MEWKDSVVICVPTYGHFAYAERAVRSALASSADVRVLLVDDASKDAGGYAHLAGLFVDEPRVRCHRFEENAGLTRSWNYGFTLACDAGALAYGPGNSDLVFSGGSISLLIEVLREYGYALVGPLTNAPGTVKAQDVRRYLSEYRAADEPEAVEQVGSQLRVLDIQPVTSGLNGFFMLGMCDSLRGYMWSGSLLYDPGKRMKGNEDELQRRVWARRGTTAIVPQSFVFHYRGVTRGIHRGRACHGAYRG